MRFVLSRLATGVLTLLAMTLIVFALVRLHGDPLDVLLSGTFATAEQRAQLAEQLGLDQPIPTQYVRFLGSALQGDFGVSVVQRRPVRDLVVERLPATFELAAIAIVVGILIGGPLGVASAIYRNTAFDWLAKVAAMLGQSLPVFVSGTALIWLFSVTLRWLPTSGREGPQSYVLPSLAIGWFIAAGIMRLVRSSMLAVLSADYILFARSKGVPERSVIWRHALRNAMLPTLTFLGLVFASLLTGSVVVENVFAWPGVGRLAIGAVQSQDFPIVQMVVLVFTLAYVVVNLIIDVLAAYLNPLIRN